jgi:TPR repeat protein
MPAPDSATIYRNADTQPILVGPPAPPVPRRPRWRYLIGGFIAVLTLAGAALSLFRDHPSAFGADLLDGTRAGKNVPPALRPYYERAVTGDASAMRMLGTMYYNGLNVPQDAREGIRWYRKAAAAGSVAAKKDLEQLGLAPAQP